MAAFYCDLRLGGEMADATDLKSVGSNPVRVRLPPQAPAGKTRQTAISLRAAGGRMTVWVMQARPHALLDSKSQPLRGLSHIPP